MHKYGKVLSPRRLQFEGVVQVLKHEVLFLHPPSQHAQPRLACRQGEQAAVQACTDHGHVEPVAFHAAYMDHCLRRGQGPQPRLNSAGHLGPLARGLLAPKAGKRRSAEGEAG